MHCRLAPVSSVALSLIVAVALQISAVALASAATITVNSTADNTTAGDGQCTLREAIANVDASADTTGGDCMAGTGSGDTVTFAVTLPATIKLGLGELDIGQNVTITGPTSGPLHVRGHGGRVFKVTAGATGISDLIIENGNANRDADPFTESLGGGIYNRGTMTLTNCTLRGNRARTGGGIFNNAGTMTLTNCTLSRNSGRYLAGGISNSSGSITLTNCTVSGNRASQANYGPAAGIYNGGAAGTMTLVNCTVSGNKPSSHRIAGIENDGGPITLVNTIVANATGRNCSGTITSNGHNLDSDGTCFTSGGTDLVNTDPMLARLGDYGGPTETMALCSGASTPAATCAGASPAIDAGDDAVTGPPYNLTTDQRGLPRDAGLHVDIGAYEVQ